LKIGRPPVSFELCGGTHVSARANRDVPYCQRSSVGSGLRTYRSRDRARAEAYFQKLTQDWQEIARSLGANSEILKNKVLGVVSALDDEKKQRQISKKN